MRALVIVLILGLFSISSVYSQTTSSSGEWSVGANWVGGSSPGYTNIAKNVVIENRIHSNSSIVYKDGGSNKNSLTVNDTLIIYGSLTLGSFDDVTVGDNGVLIVFGDFTADNQVNVGNGGYFVVLGNYTLPSGGTSHTNVGDAKTFITGIVSDPNNDDLNCDPNVDVNCGYGDGSDLFTDPIFEFISEISDESCSISLSAVIADESALLAADGAINVTLIGGVSPSFSWNNDAVTEDISGLTEGDYSLVVFDGVCVIDTTFSVGGNCCGTSSYYSKDNITGNWEDVSSWASPDEGWRPLTPPVDGTSSQPLCVKGTITLNGDLTITNTTYTVCDTLVITGNLDVGSFALNVSPNGVLIVLGNYTGTNGSSVNAGKVIIAGVVDENNTLSGSGDTYIFDPAPTGTFDGGFTSAGDETDLSNNDVDLHNFYQSVSVSCTNPTAALSVLVDSVCTGSNVSITIDFTAGTAPFTFTVQRSKEISGTLDENLSNISDNPYTYIPVSAPTWWVGDSNPYTDYTYTITTITDANGCSNTNQGSVLISVFKIPVSGPQYHIGNTWGN